MLKNSSVYATIGVKDFSNAKEFYGSKLGLTESEMAKDIPGGVLYDSGDSCIFVYESQFGGTNEATSATWLVDDIEAVVKDLQEKGISFEHYEFPGSKLEGDIHVMGEMKSAWFKDPDGNILNVSQR